MARTKKNEIAAQDEQEQDGELIANDTELCTESGEESEQQDATELAAPSDNADFPLLLPEDIEDGDEAAADSDAASEYPVEDFAESELSSAELPEDFQDETPSLPEDVDSAGDFGTASEMPDMEKADTDEDSTDSSSVLDAQTESLMGGGVIEMLDSAEATPAKARSPRKKADSTEKSAAKPAARTRRQTGAPVLTIEKNSEVETAASREEILWHEIQNAARTRRILTGTLGGIERLENGKSVAVVYYKELRVIIPTKEMMLLLGGDNPGYGSMAERENKILGNMLGCDIDFVLKGIDSKTRSAVGSRSEAMLRKRKTFFMDKDVATGTPLIHEGRVVQARIIAVASKVVRVEVFGVETSILARDLSWEWIGDAHERFNVGDRILVRVNKIYAESINEISIQADARSMTANTVAENLQKCRVQGKYAGVVTDIHKGVVFIRLSIGVNAIAHSCLDSRMPAKQDEVSFVVTHTDSEQGVAIGLITRIIKQKI